MGTSTNERKFCIHLSIHYAPALVTCETTQFIGMDFLRDLAVLSSHYANSAIVHHTKLQAAVCLRRAGSTAVSKGDDSDAHHVSMPLLFLLPRQSIPGGAP